MARDIYRIGSVGNPITLTVTVTTPGIATTEVKLFLPDGTIINKGNSTNGAGLISSRLIDLDTKLDLSSLKIETYILLTKIPQSAWQSCFNNLEIHYYLSGGIPGQITPIDLLSSEKNKSTSGETIIAVKEIDLSI